MDTFVEKLSNGNVIRYNRIESGTCYHSETVKEVVDILEYSRTNRERIRIWYGENGKSWNEENYIIGYVGRSTGDIKIPLLIHNSRSRGGGGLLDHRVVKIVRISDHRVLYEHKKFKQALFTCQENKVFQDGKEFAPNCTSKEQAKRLCDFMNGFRHSK